MKAAAYHAFREPLEIVTLPDPAPPAGGAVLRVLATGVCRSDWHGWQGHDADISDLPHVPGHELAGEIVAVGQGVERRRVGERVTMPFVAGCGDCGDCRRGDPQVCPDQFQPGFTAWGSFAELVAVEYADANLVPLPESISNAAAAALGCRVGTAYRAIAAQAAVKPGDWVAIHGCGGVGLAAVQIAAALGARPIAVDIRSAPLELATTFGAEATLNSAEVDNLPAAIHDLTHGGADASLDALGSRTTLANSIHSLRRRGRHVQVGLLAGADADPPVDMGRVIGWELELLGSHGMQAAAYPELFALAEAGKLDLRRMVEQTIPLAQAPEALAAMNDYRGVGATVIELD